MKERAAMAETVPVLERSLREAEAMQQNGFMEETDADRIRIELANTNDQLLIFQRQGVLARNLLALLSGTCRRHARWTSPMTCRT